MHRIGARADRKVTEELVNAFKRVTSKENLLFAIAEAPLERPDEAVREVVFPAVSGGEQTLRELVYEFKTKGPVYRRTVQTTLKASYSNHYRSCSRCSSSGRTTPPFGGAIYPRRDEIERIPREVRQANN